MPRLIPVAVHSGPDFAQFCPVAAIRTAKASDFAGFWPVWARAVLDRARERRGLRSVFCGSVKQPGSLGRRCPAFRPQSGQILAGQVIQNPLDRTRTLTPTPREEILPEFRGESEDRHTTGNLPTRIRPIFLFSYLERLATLGPWFIWTNNPCRNLEIAWCP